MTDPQARADYYREKALDARIKAARMRDLDARDTMFDAAFLWDAMARTADPHPKLTSAATRGYLRDRPAH